MQETTPVFFLITYYIYLEAKTHVQGYRWYGRETQSKKRDD